MVTDISSTASLISHIHSESADFLKKKMAAHGLEELVSSHGFILFSLSKTDRMTMGELAEKINRDKSTTTVLVRKLCKEGFVRMEKSLTDSRCKYLMLTERGREWNKLTANLSHDLLKTYFKGFTQDEKETLLALLSKISANLENAE